MSQSDFYDKYELLNMGFTDVGRNVQVSRLARFYGFKGKIGDHSRIDDFAILKGHVDIGAYVHISSYCLVSGVAGVVKFGDCSTTAAYTAIYTSSDDYKGPFLCNPLVPKEHVNPLTGDVILGEGALVGAHCVILPGASLGDFATVGALCIVNSKMESGELAVTSGPPRVIGKRDAAIIATLRKRVEDVKKHAK
jgi:acetyltransferase-like isoleucine patch superfamily enzyme